MAHPDYQNVPLGHGEWLRQVANEIELPLLNRYMEFNPSNLGYGSYQPFATKGPAQYLSVLSRPGLKRWLQCGSGPITNVYTCPGSFSDALFVASGGSVYRVDTDETVTLVGSGITGDPRDYISMAGTAALGTTPEYLFIAGGGTFYVYIENGYALGTLQNASGNPANTDVVKIDTTYYEFTTGSVDTGTPDGTMANPWLVEIGATAEASYQNLYWAINISGVAGTNYSTATIQNPTAQGFQTTASNLIVAARVAGSSGNSISTTTTSSTIAWGHSTLQNGGAPMFQQVQTPNAEGISYVVFLSSFILAVVAEGTGENGRFYWIEPGSITIAPLNFATAERSPDPIVAARVIGDQVYFFGTNSCEVWYANTNATDPTQAFLRVQGVTFDRGIWQGSDAQIRDMTFVVDNDGAVWSIVQGSPTLVSNNAVQEMIREAIRDQIIALHP